LARCQPSAPAAARSAVATAAPVGAASAAASAGAARGARRHKPTSPETSPLRARDRPMCPRTGHVRCEHKDPNANAWPSAPCFRKTTLGGGAHPRGRRAPRRAARPSPARASRPAPSGRRAVPTVTAGASPLIARPWHPSPRSNARGQPPQLRAITLPWHFFEFQGLGNDPGGRSKLRQPYTDPKYPPPPRPPPRRRRHRAARRSERRRARRRRRPCPRRHHPPHRSAPRGFVREGL
jgi:hypothetical protein